LVSHGVCGGNGNVMRTRERWDSCSITSCYSFISWWLSVLHEDERYCVLYHPVGMIIQLSEQP
jgi:hypothetical protein